MIQWFRLAAYAALSAAAAISQVQAQESTVKIGVLTDMSSLYSDLSGPGAVVAVKMAVADFGGSVLSRKIEVINADHQNKPDVAAAIARQWLDQGVDMITDLTTSSVALAVQEVARDKKKVILINGAASSDLTGKNCAPTSVHWTYDTTALANGTGSAVVRAGGKNWFFITADYAFRPCP
jgi:branched-chain amino acid transport system substrate-binding protein